jgi:hypothetical protein
MNGAFFPSFAASWAEENAPANDGLVDGVYHEWTHHAVTGNFVGSQKEWTPGFSKLWTPRIRGV